MTLTRLVKIDLLPVFNFCDLFVLTPSLYVVAVHVLLACFLPASSSLDRFCYKKGAVATRSAKSKISLSSAGSAPQHPRQMLLIFLSSNLFSSSAVTAFIASVLVKAAVGRTAETGRPTEDRRVQSGPGMSLASREEDEPPATRLGEPAVTRCAKAR